MTKTNLHTLEGWKAIAASTNHEAFITVFGRDPEPGEVESWVSELREAAEGDIDRSYTDRLIKVNDQWHADRYFCNSCEGGIAND